LDKAIELNYLYSSFTYITLVQLFSQAILQLESQLQCFVTIINAWSSIRVRPCCAR